MCKADGGPSLAGVWPPVYPVIVDQAEWDHEQRPLFRFTSPRQPNIMGASLAVAQ
jgi:hypothetical protein